VSAATTYAAWLTEHLAPTWLRGTWGAALLGTWGTAFDRAIQATKDGVKLRWAATAPDDALGHVGGGLNLERYGADTAATYRARLGRVWELWDFAGAASGLLERLYDTGLSTVELWPWRSLGYPPPPYETHWSAFWAVLTGHPWSSDGLWGDPAVWGDGPGTWGSSATTTEVAEVRAVVRKWKPAAEICPAVIVVTGGDVWGPSGVFLNGTWGGSSAHWGTL